MARKAPARSKTRSNSRVNIDAVELALWIDNTKSLHDDAMSIRRRLAGDLADRTYTKSAAKAEWLRLADRAARDRYRTDTDDGRFTLTVREEVAKTFSYEFFAVIAQRVKEYRP